MKINPESEVKYRIKLAEGYAERARKFLRQGFYKECVEAAQLSIENSAKAIVALRRMPSWSHDPSQELYEIIPELPEKCRKLAERLAHLSHAVAPEHGTSTYGRPSESSPLGDLR